MSEYFPQIESLPSSTTYVHTPTIIEPMVHPRAAEAKAKGMTVEELLEHEKRMALGSGSIYPDTGSPTLNNYLSIYGSHDPEQIKRELAYRAEKQAEAEAEALKTADAVLSMALPSTYINTALKWNGKEEMSDAASLGVDLAAPFVGLVGGAAKVGMSAVKPIIKNRKIAKTISKRIDDTLKGDTWGLSELPVRQRFQLSNLPTIEPNFTYVTDPTQIVRDGKLWVSPRGIKDPPVGGIKSDIVTPFANTIVQVPGNPANFSTPFTKFWGPSDLTGAKISVLDPATNVYHHTYLIPGTLTESKGSVSKLYKPITRTPDGRTYLDFPKRPSMNPYEWVVEMRPTGIESMVPVERRGGRLNYFDYLRM